MENTGVLEKHALLVAKVSDQVKNFYQAKKPARIYHGSTNSTRPFSFKEGEVIDVSELKNILEVNVKEGYALVEPNVSMEELVRATLSSNMIPPVVMEFPGITVGGAIQGGAGESSSFKFGLFQNICTEYEMVLGNGEVLTVSPSVNPDLYWGTSGSYGSLGVITLIKLKLIPARKFVELSYFPTKGINETLEFIQKCVNDDNDFLDAVMFSKNSGVVMAGKFTDEKKFPLATFHRARNEWFYLHVKKSKKRNETIPLARYLFRYNRGAFWMGKCSFKVLGIPFNRFTRYVFNIFSPTKTLYRALHSANLSQEYIIQDFCLPSDKARDFLNFSDTTLEIYPIWLCPLKTETQAKLSANYLNSVQAVNIGIYGKPRTTESMIQLNKDIETKAKNLGGRKWLYAHAYYSREEFWNIYDLSWYSGLRKKYHAETVFPDIYEKVHVKGEIKGSIAKGVFGFIRSPFRLRN